MRIILLIFCVILVTSCRTKIKMDVFYPSRDIRIGRIDKLRFEKDIKPYCTGVFILGGDTVTHIASISEAFPIGYFNCTDTVVIRKRDIAKICAPFHIFINRRRLGRIPHRGFHDIVTGVQLVNRATREPLNGLYKIIYSRRKHSIGYFLNGRPFVPLNITYFSGVRNTEILGFRQYYIDNEYAYHSIFLGPMEVPIELVIKRNGEEVTMSAYNWDTRRKYVKRIYKIDGDYLLLQATHHIRDFDFRTVFDDSGTCGSMHDRLGPRSDRRMRPRN